MSGWENPEIIAEMEKLEAWLVNSAGECLGTIMEIEKRDALAEMMMKALTVHEIPEKQITRSPDELIYTT